ncbi:MAG: nucleotidyltransferase family protein [Clostridia bacterium]|nr:nucleotidyltransferase family protein [Clostridia bacterium]
MKIAGIIAEYNPLHAGHVYHMDETRRRTRCDGVVCVLGGAFTQRGLPAVMDKFARVRMALAGGADAVIELPAVYAARPAQIFALGGVGILARLGADVLSFGCETEDAGALFRLSELISGAELKPALTGAAPNGMSYPRALAAAAEKALPGSAQLLAQPNTVLALEYLSEARRRRYCPELLIVRRTAPYNASGYDTRSASGIRNMLREGRAREAAAELPERVSTLFLREAEAGLASEHLPDECALYALRSLSGWHSCSPDCAEGLEMRILKAARSAPGTRELIENAKCKRYTRARIQRAVSDLTLRLPEAPREIPYIRLLGMRKDAGKLVNELSLRAGGLLVSDPVKLAGDPVFEAECRATDLWGLCTRSPAYRICGRELTEKFIVAD